MNQIKSKKMLAIEISKLQTFKNPKVSLEQYPTDSEIMAEILWFSGMMGELNNKVIVDLGAGTGIIGLGAALMGANAILVESDPKALEIAKKNYKKLKSETEMGEVEFINKNIKDFNNKADVVIQNPPFGTKKKHADKEFLEKAFTIAPIIHTLHKAETKKFIEQISKDNNFKTTHQKNFNFPLKSSQKFHKKKIKQILVGYWRLERLINKTK